jgi:hypothetical protein
LSSAAAQGMAQGQAIHDAFLVAAAVCSIGIVASLIRGSGRPGDGVAAQPITPTHGVGA